MPEKVISTRISLKHDVEANWKLATVFVPRAGEVIIYDKDDTHTSPRIKIGDGNLPVTKLPFLYSKAGNATQPIFIKEDGTIAATTYQLNATVPEGAVFTDTHYTAKMVATSNSINTEITGTEVINPYLNIIEDGAVRSSTRIVGEGATSVKTNANGEIVIKSTEVTVPKALKNPYLLKVRVNARDFFSYDGSAQRIIEFTGGTGITLVPDGDTGNITINSTITATDTKVTNTLNNTTKAYLTGTISASTNTGTQIFDSNVFLGTIAGQLNAISYVGNSAILNTTGESEDSQYPQIVLKRADGVTSEAVHIKGTDKELRLMTWNEGAYRAVTLRNHKNSASSLTDLNNALTFDVVDSEHQTDNSYPIFHAGRTTAIPVKNGGTGETSLGAAMQSLAGALNESRVKSNDNDYFISQTSSGGTDVNFYKKPISTLTSYFNDKFEAKDTTILRQTNVVNELTSESTIAPLSAAMGKSLKDTFDTHKHSADDITSGTLAVARGGTGVGTYKELQEKFYTQDAPRANLLFTKMPIYFVNSTDVSHFQAMLSGVLETDGFTIGTYETKDTLTSATNEFIFAYSSDDLNTLFTVRPSSTTSSTRYNFFHSGMTIPVANGGTGATTAAEALTNLGAASATHTHSASSITEGTLALANGGTGATTATQARANLGAAAENHTHGNISSTGTIGTTEGQFLMTGANGILEAKTADEVKTALDFQSIKVTTGTTDLEAGVSELAAGAIYVYYEE